MNIGDEIAYKAEVFFHYDENNKRTYERTPLDEPEVGFIVGGCIRRLGIYHKGNMRPFDPEDGEPAKLVVTETLSVVQVRKTFYGRIIDVHPDDLLGVEK